MMKNRVQLTFLTKCAIEDYVFIVHYENMVERVTTSCVTDESKLVYDESGEINRTGIFSTNVYITVYEGKEDYTILPFTETGLAGSIDEEKKQIHVIVCRNRTKSHMLTKEKPNEEQTKEVLD